MRLFVDTSAFVALEDQNDQNHRRAVEYRTQLRSSKTPFRLLYTSNYVVDETFTLLRAELGHAVAVAFGETLRSSAALKVLWVTPELDVAAWEIFRAHGDKPVSYTDCTSFALMQAEAMTTAFAFDKHFRQYRLRTLP